MKGSPQKRRFCGAAKAELYREQARKLRNENDLAEKK